MAQYADVCTQRMLKKRLAGRRQMRTAEFFEFFREYLHSEYDLMGSLNVQDFLWLREHMADYHLFEPANQMLAGFILIFIVIGTAHYVKYGLVEWVFIITLIAAIVTGMVELPAWMAIFTVLPVFLALVPFRIIGTLHIAAMVTMLAWLIRI